MQDSNQFNQVTVEWNKPGFRVETGQAAAYIAAGDDVARFQRDGVMLLPGAATQWVERLRRGLQRNLERPQAYAFPCESNPAGEPGRFFDSYCNWQLIPEYLDYVTHSEAAAMAGQFMQSEQAQFFHEHAFMKAPGTQRATPWHQDLPYYCINGMQTASLYIALDAAPAEVAVQFVKGSHRWQQLYYPRVFDDGSAFNVDAGDSSLLPAPDIEAGRETYEITDWSLAAGDVVVFDFRTLHGTGDAEVKSMRRAFTTRWLGDDVVYCDRPGEVSPPYVDHGMAPGDKMRADWFPILWRKADSGR